MFIRAYKKYKSNEFSKDLVFYTFFGVLEKITPFLIINLSALFLTPDIVGEYSYFLIIVTLLSSITSLELHRYVEYIYFNNSEYNKSKSKLIILVITLFLLFLPFAYVFLLYNLNLSFFYSFIIVIALPFIKLKEIQFAEWRCALKKRKIVFFSIFISILRLTLFFAFLLFGIIDNSIYLIWTFVFPLIIVTIVMYISEGRLNKIQFPDWRYVKRALQFSTPFVLYSFSGVLQNQIDKIFIYNYVSVDSLGIYSTLFSFAFIIKFISDSFSHAWVPHFLDKNSKVLTESNTTRYKIKYIKVLVVVSSIVLVIVLVIIFLMYPSEYYKNSYLLIFIFAGYIFRGVKQIEIPYFVRENKTKVLTIEFFIVLSLSLLFSYFLIVLLNLGMFGASIVFLINQVLSFSLLNWLKDK